MKKNRKKQEDEIEKEKAEEETIERELEINEKADQEVEDEDALKESPAENRREVGLDPREYEQEELERQGYNDEKGLDVSEDKDEGAAA
jgi:hypothetical protein